MHGDTENNERKRTESIRIPDWFLVLRVSVSAVANAKLNVAKSEPLFRGPRAAFRCHV